MNRRQEIQESIFSALRQSENLSFILEAVADPTVQDYIRMGLNPPEGYSTRLKSPAIKERGRPARNILQALSPSAKTRDTARRVSSSFVKAFVPGIGRLGPRWDVGQILATDEENLAKVRASTETAVARLEKAPSQLQARFAARTDPAVLRQKAVLALNARVRGRPPLRDPITGRPTYSTTHSAFDIEQQERRILDAERARLAERQARVAAATEDARQRAKLAVKNYPKYGSKAGAIAGRTAKYLTGVGLGGLVFAGVGALKDLFTSAGRQGAGAPYEQPVGGDFSGGGALPNSGQRTF